ncbi:hypothetical protein E8E14_010084 [Neopestalotiopsis sp. 37M]|nr:hypothetical protein E8E14_010084 [Neopestalotiopsis sp. 37M]
MHAKTGASARCLSAYLLLWSTSKVIARPNPQDDQVTETNTITPVTEVATVDGEPVTAIYTPTSLSITGLAPPITAATTITTTDDSGKTVAVAIAAGAGVVAAGALAGWFFTPVVDGPPAPTSPLPYSTSSQNDEPPTTTQVTDTTTATTTTPFACPFPTTDSSITFSPVAKQPSWTVDIPSQTVTSFKSDCTPEANEGQLARGIDPGFIKELSAVFCTSDTSKDVSKTLGKDDLPDTSTWKRDDGPEEKVKFTFDFKSQNDGCSSHCPDAYTRLITSCQYNSHYLYGGGSLEQGCGNYTLDIEGDPILDLKCTGDNGKPMSDYLQRDSALAAIDNFCTAHDGKTVKKGDQASFIDEATFSISYADPCGGSGSYTVTKDLCVKYLSKTLDECDTNTQAYKHGGTVEDTDNCGLFAFHPTNYSVLMCFDEAVDKGYLQNTNHATVTKDIALDAINAFCDRSGDGQQYTLDPSIQVDSGSFIQDTCKEKGLASCGYFYNNDGTRVTKEGSLGDLSVRIAAKYWNPNNAMQCSPSQIYEIHGDRCKTMLANLIGDGPTTGCAGDTSKLDLGALLESGEKGCVFWSVVTTPTR